MQGSFHQRGFALLPELIEAGHLGMARIGMDTSLRTGALAPSREVALAEDEYSPVLGELYLRHYRPAIEAVVGRPLAESYAFWRRYRCGALLEPHVDRESCEVTVSATIASEPNDRDWPFGLTDLAGVTERIALPPGAGIVIQGHRITHWREPLAAGEHRQIFLHYVYRDGDFAGHAFDGRGADPLGLRARS